MGWKESSEPAPAKTWTAEEILKKETHWIGSYNEPDRWIKDFKEVFYSLDGEYKVDESLTLYRFKLDETKRDQLAPGASSFHNVLIDKRIIPPKLGTPYR
jgi:hypothetical protein